MYMCFDVSRKHMMQKYYSARKKYASIKHNLTTCGRGWACAVNRLPALRHRNLQPPPEEVQPVQGLLRGVLLNQLANELPFPRLSCTNRQGQP